MKQRSNSRSFTTAATVVCAVVLQGCVFGQTRDAETGNPLVGVRVDAYGGCYGDGCAAPDHGVEYTANRDVAGSFVFDGWGDYLGLDRQQLIYPAEGADSIKMVFSPTDGQHLSRTVYHHRDYQPFESAISGTTKTYPVSGVHPVYLCKAGQVDTDGDGVCDFAERKYGTDPNNQDTDGDGFSDPDELFGMVGPGIDMRFYGASATRKDVFVYYDYYAAPMADGLAQVVQAYADAPIVNWDKSTGISLHLIAGTQIPAADQVPTFYEQSLGGPNWKTPFNTIKNKYFPAKFARIAHYALFGKEMFACKGPNQCGYITGVSKGASAHDFLVTVESTPDKQFLQASTFMHELGHNMGLLHGGNDVDGRKPNYLSVMSYSYQETGLHRDGQDGVLDYSRIEVTAVDEMWLYETAGMSAVDPNRNAELATYRMKPWYSTTPAVGNCHGRLDFSGDGAISSARIGVDLNGNGSAEVFPASWNDWDHLIYTGHQDNGGVIGSGASVSWRSSGAAPLKSASEPQNELFID